MKKTLDSPTDMASEGNESTVQKVTTQKQRLASPIALPRTAIGITSAQYTQQSVERPSVTAQMNAMPIAMNAPPAAADADARAHSPRPMRHALESAADRRIRSRRP